MAETLTYQCPHCGGVLSHRNGQLELTCEHCGSSFSEAWVERYYERLGQSWDVQADGLTTCTCHACGAQMVTQSLDIVTTCPYCGNYAVHPSRLSGITKPNALVPFQVTKQEALKAMHEFFRGNSIFTPKHIRKLCDSDEIVGVYVPMWMYEGQSRGSGIVETYYIVRWSRFHDERTCHVKNNITCTLP